MAIADINFRCLCSQLRIVFDNWVTIVVLAVDKDKVLFDGKNLSLTTSNQWDTASVSGYAIVTFRVTHDFHYVTVTPSGSASFACYVYGHSINPTSASAYGFSANYKSNDLFHLFIRLFVHSFIHLASYSARKGFYAVSQFLYSNHKVNL